ncbi:hypothetical protein [Phycicoccus sp.]|uniref:hypothetical protein n=1 Tax=Phycicoccus sp. TaxID=1902410 RepID=UPI002C53DF38|nr:hypothetical protein [Phycicoccus sp.]HMM95300.1 hypothetical protein [Phycicoccus sp.]
MTAADRSTRQPAPDVDAATLDAIEARARKFDIIRALAEALGFCTCSRAQTNRAGHHDLCPWVEGGKIDRLAMRLSETTITPQETFALVALARAGLRVPDLEAENERLREGYLEQTRLLDDTAEALDQSDARIEAAERGEVEAERDASHRQAEAAEARADALQRQVATAWDEGAQAMKVARLVQGESLPENPYRALDAAVPSAPTDTDTDEAGA